MGPRSGATFRLLIVFQGLCVCFQLINGLTVGVQFPRTTYPYTPSGVQQLVTLPVECQVIKQEGSKDLPEPSITVSVNPNPRDENPRLISIFGWDEIPLTVKKNNCSVDAVTFNLHSQDIQKDLTSEDDLYVKYTLSFQGNDDVKVRSNPSQLLIYKRIDVILSFAENQMIKLPDDVCLQVIRKGSFEGDINVTLTLDNKTVLKNFRLNDNGGNLCPENIPVGNYTAVLESYGATIKGSAKLIVAKDFSVFLTEGVSLVVRPLMDKLVDLNTEFEKLNTSYTTLWAEYYGLKHNYTILKKNYTGLDQRFKNLKTPSPQISIISNPAQDSGLLDRLLKFLENEQNINVSKVRDPCYDYDCGHGNCSSVNGSVNCDCEDGYVYEVTEGTELPKCIFEECHPNPCDNGGTCGANETADESYHCTCKTGYTGKDCSKDVCESYCQNDGDCSVSAGSDHHPQCDCDKTDYFGPTCEFKECDKQQNETAQCGVNGKCYVDGNTDPQCICGSNYFGKHCELKECNSSQQQEGPKCGQGQCYVDSDKSPQCYCGDTACKNRADCGGEANNLKCKCKDGFEGGDCTTWKACKTSNCDLKNIESCGPSNPQNTGEYNCICKVGFSGKFCNVTNPVTEAAAADSTTAASITANHTALIAVILFCIALVVIVVGYVVYHWREKIMSYAKSQFGGGGGGLPSSGGGRTRRRGKNYKRLPTNLHDALHQD